MRVVVTNTGPLLHLHEARGLALLRLTGRIYVPPAVATELAALRPAAPAALPAWVTLTRLHSTHQHEARAWQQADLLHPGEAEALALARQEHAAWFLTDDAAARLLAQTLGLEVHGSLGIVLWAAAKGHLEATTATDILERLIASSLWVSPRVQQEARAALAQLYA